MKIDQPSINRQAEDPELEQLAYDANAALDAGRQAGQTTLQRYKEAGDALSKAKKKCKHGQWLPYLKKHNIDRGQAARAIRISANWSKCVRSDTFDEALAILAKKDEEAEKTKPVEVAPLCDRCKRVGPTKDCHACEELEIAFKGGRNGREPGDDSDQEAQDAEEEAARKKASEEAKKNQGRPVFEWKPVEYLTGKFTRLADDLGKAAEAKEAPEFQELRDKIYDVHQTFARLYELVTKQKAPIDEGTDK